jgi:hypothetical protein
MRAYTITTKPKLLRRLVLLVGAVGALMLGIAAPASAESSDPPSCFGGFVGSAATSAPQVVGNFVSNNATEVWNQPETSTGQTGVPGLKASCAS